MPTTTIGPSNSPDSDGTQVAANAPHIASPPPTTDALLKAADAIQVNQNQNDPTGSNNDSGAASLDIALQMLGHHVDTTTAATLNADGSIRKPGVTPDVVASDKKSGSTALGQLEQTRSAMASNAADGGNDRSGIDRNAKSGTLERSAAGHDTISTGTDMVRGAVLEGFGVDHVDTNSSAIQTRLANDHAPIVVDGNKTGANGKAQSPSWITVEGVDKNTGKFIIGDPSSSHAQEWSADELDSFMGGKGGGDAIEILKRRPVTANATNIEAALAADKNPIHVDGSEAGGTPGSVKVTGYDQNSAQFSVTDSSGKGHTWTESQLQKYMQGTGGGSAYEVGPGYAPAAEQSQIDAAIAAAPASQRDYARWSVPLIMDQCAKSGITDKGQIAYILATAEHESQFGAPATWSATNRNVTQMYEAPSDNGRPLTHSQQVANFDSDYSGVAGNRTAATTNPGDDGTNDGFNYRGRGYVQLTGLDNYETASRKLGLRDVVPPAGIGFDAEAKRNSEIPALAAHPDTAIRPDVAAFNLVVGMRDGWYGPKPLSAYIDGEKQDFFGARQTVNANEKAAQIATIAQKYLRALDN